MQSKIHRVLILLFLVSIFLFVLSCNKGNYIDNQVIIKLIAVDNQSKKARLNKFDTVVVRKESLGYLVKTFREDNNYITDSTGSVYIKIDTTKIYDISVKGMGVLGGEMYFPNYLKNNKQIKIEVKPIESY